MKIYITGMTGFLGTNLYQWIRRNHPEVEVYGGSRRTGFDVRDYDQVKKAVCGMKYVFHLAAQTHVDFSLHREKEAQDNFIETNLGGTHNVIHACRKYGVKMIFTSTSEVYGTNQKPGVLMKEDHPLLAQAGIYATSKMAADATCRMATMTTDSDIVILRPFNLWGTNQSVEKLIPRFINKALKKEPLTIYGDGKQKRDYLHAQDCAEAIWMAKDLPTGTICNIATGKNYTVNQIANMITKSRWVETKHVESRPAELKELLGSYKKLNKLTGWEPTTFLNGETMADLMDWYRVNGFIRQPRL